MAGMACGAPRAGNPDALRLARTEKALLDGTRQGALGSELERRCCRVGLVPGARSQITHDESIADTHPPRAHELSSLARARQIARVLERHHLWHVIEFDCARAHGADRPSRTPEPPDLQDGRPPRSSHGARGARADLHEARTGAVDQSRSASARIPNRTRAATRPRAGGAH